MRADDDMIDQFLNEIALLAFEKQLNTILGE